MAPEVGLTAVPVADARVEEQPVLTAPEASLTIFFTGLRREKRSFQ